MKNILFIFDWQGTLMDDAGRLYDASMATLELLRGECDMAVISSHDGKYLRSYIKKLGINDYFITILGSGDALDDKPSPEVGALALQQSGKIYAAIWFIGDSEKDMICAGNMGAKSILIHNDDNDFYYKPDLVASGHNELQEIIKTILSNDQ